MTKGKFYIWIILITALLGGCRQRPENSAPLAPSPGTTEFSGAPVAHAMEIHAEEKTLTRFAEHTIIDPAGPSSETSHTSEVTDYYRPDVSFKKPIPVRKPMEFPVHHDRNQGIHADPVDLLASYGLKKGRISEGIWLVANFDNDLLNYTDIYYTSGQSIELFHPALMNSPVSRLLPGLNSSVNFYSISLVQNLYTPKKLDKPEIRYGDRPFASYLYLGHNRYSLHPEKRMRLITAINLGVIGPNSMGGWSQDLIHGEEPVGWINQVANDLVVNFDARIEKSVLAKAGFDVAVTTGGQAGTLYDNLTAGLFLQIGKTTRRYSSIFQTLPGPSKLGSRIRYYASLDLENKLVIYDATLQGGLINRSSVYTIDPDDISRYVLTGRLGLGIGLGRYSLELEQVFLTPEFEGGKHHFWLRISNIVFLN